MARKLSVHEGLVTSIAIVWLGTALGCAGSSGHASVEYSEPTKYELGLDAGYHAGTDQGYSDGYAEGNSEGYNRGFDDTRFYHPCSGY